MQDNLYRAFEETAVSRIIEKVPQMPDHRFSRKFERKMRKLIRYEDSEPVHFHKITLKKLFIYITVALITASIMAFSVGAVRDFFKNFFMEIFATHTEVQIVDSENIQNSILDKYSICVPDNFVQTEKFEYEILVCCVYRTADNDYITFNQYVKSEYDVNINTENRTMDHIEVNGNDGYIVELGNDEYYISWDNGDYIFDITGNIGKNALIDAANSVQKVE